MNQQLPMSTFSLPKLMVPMALLILIVYRYQNFVIVEEGPQVRYDKALCSNFSSFTNDKKELIGKCSRPGTFFEYVMIPLNALLIISFSFSFYFYARKFPMSTGRNIFMFALMSGLLLILTYRIRI